MTIAVRSSLAGWLIALMRAKDDPVRFQRAWMGPGSRTVGALMASLSVGIILLADPGIAPNAGELTGDDSTALSVSAGLLEAYEGDYELAENSILSITRDGSALFVQLTGFKRSVLQPRSGTAFLYKAQKVQITFTRDENGLTTMAVFRQNGHDFEAPRVDAAVAQQINGAVKEKIDSQKATQGGDTVLSQLLEELRVGNPDYSKLSPLGSELLRRNLVVTQATVSGWGPLQSVRFIRVDRQGWDVYQVQHEHHSSEWRIAITPTGLVGGLLETRGSRSD